jgi:uncharacterized protein
VMFKSGETFAAAWLFLPETAVPGARVPAVAMAHGLGAVKEMYLEPFARRFAEAGVAALVFDYRGFGASGGEPRQRIYNNGFDSTREEAYFAIAAAALRRGRRGLASNCPKEAR